jgi:microcystin-dependent protein
VSATRQDYSAGGASGVWNSGGPIPIRYLAVTCGSAVSGTLNVWYQSAVMSVAAAGPPDQQLQPGQSAVFDTGLSGGRVVYVADAQGGAFAASLAGDVVRIDTSPNPPNVAEVLQPQLIQTGDVIFTVTAGARPGFLVCDGSAVSRTTYAQLFGLVGTTFGAGDGSTTFNVPDLRGRMVIGPGTGTAPGAINHPLSSTGGEETHVLAVGEMPAHGHTIAGNAGFITGGGATASIPVTGASFKFTSTTDNAGGGGAHNTMSPFLVLTPLIKT